MSLALEIIITYLVSCAFNGKAATFNRGKLRCV